MLIHNPGMRDLDRNFNSFYNSLFVKRYSFSDGFVDSTSLHGEDWKTKGFNAYQTVWLSNLDRLMSMLFSAETDFNSSDYELIDLGAGKSISTIYLCHNYCFNSSLAIDIDASLLDDGIKNLEKYAAKEGRQLNIQFLRQDIQKFRLEDGKKYILFAFNSVEWNVFQKFFTNNIDILSDTNSIMLYANDRYINQLIGVSSLLARDEYYNLSVVKF